MINTALVIQITINTRANGDLGEEVLLTNSNNLLLCYQVSES